MLLLIWHTAYEFVCFPTSFGTSSRPYAEAQDGLREWDSLNPKRFVDGSIQRLLQPSLEILEKKRKSINKGIYGGAPVTMHQMDAFDFVERTVGDLLYLDPPYAGTLGYMKTYEVLDHILTGSPATAPSSTFSKDTEALDLLFEKAGHIPHWVLSYGNKQIDKEELVALVRRHAGNRKVIGFSKLCKHMPHVSKNNDNQELLVIATTESEVISYAP